MTREGYIENIIYKNEENGYAVFSVQGEDGEEIFVGTLYNAGEGLYIIAEGDYVNHPQYDIQFKFTSCELRMPDDIVGIERYLASGIIKGVGEVRAKQIVKKFKTDTLRIMEEEPERLAEIKGISERQARLIATSYAEKREFQEVIMFLSEYGISVNMGMKIYKYYGDRVYEILRGNPYKLAEDITGIGFRAADEIAKRMGVDADSEYRIRSAIIYTLSLAGQDGHMYLPQSMLFDKVKEFLGHIEEDVIANQVMELAIESKIVIKNIDDEPVIYSNQNYYIELNTARLLLDLQLRYEVPEYELEAAISKIEKETDIILDEMQSTAVKSAITAGVAVITGGPGTGKTTTINTIIRYFEGEGMEIRLAAPTGRAAKRMTETTGYEAQTIHRLLELSGMPEDDREGQLIHFERNAENPLEADVIIIDEMSMVDIHLIHSLLMAVTAGTRLILVGDENQLPSVGPGNVLRDIIRSGQFPVVELKKIFRQASESDIVVNAHKINKGEQVEINNKSRDFFFLKRYDADIIIRVVIALIQEKLPKYVEAKPFEIQVLTPMRKGLLGVERLNQILQRYLNPPDASKKEREVGQGLFREGDKVMQVRNNYQLEWEIRGRYGIPIEKGVGVFNGDTGIIKTINEFAETAEVEFEDGRWAEYSFKQLDELELAYAVTIHKSQGSEYPAVIIPLLSGPRMLMNRNLLYTAVTRARKCVTVVGSEETFREMIRNEKQQRRYSSLDLRIQETE